MKKFVSLLVLTIFILANTFSVPIYAESENTATDTASSNSEIDAATYFDLAVKLIMSEYKFDVTREDLYKAVINQILTDHPELLEESFYALFGSLDKHSSYFNEEELESFFTSMSGEFCGIGVVITSGETGLLVTTVYDNSPANDVGLQVGDIITKVGDFSLAGVDVTIAQSKILGEENTPVNLTISRNGTSFEVNPVRRKIAIESGFYQTVENDTIGYISLNDFHDHAAEYVKKALEYFDSKNIKKIIFDLRNNPGGSSEVMADVSSLFIPAGPVIHFEFKNPFYNRTLYSYNADEAQKYNLVVLVNENSASASEAFSAAVQDTGAGIVVGTTTYGKGTMQNVTKFKIGGGVKLTQAEFLSPNKRHINGIGVSPDVYVEDKIVDYHNSNFKKITYERVMKNGDTGADVFALEERLYFLGYSIGIPDEIYDDKTQTAIYRFQQMTELYPYGVADITTQLKLEEILNGTQVVQNDSYYKAVELLTSHNINDYKTERSNPENVNN